MRRSELGYLEKSYPLPLVYANRLSSHRSRSPYGGFLLLPYHKSNKPVTGKQPLESLTSESECPKDLLVGHCCLRSSMQGAR